jgi:hypothetical protein
MRKQVLAHPEGLPLFWCKTMQLHQNKGKKCNLPFDLSGRKALS